MDSCPVCAFEHLGQAIIFLQEAAAAQNDPERFKDKITDATDHLIAAQYHMAMKDPKIAEEIRSIRKHVQDPLFGLPFTGEQKSIEEIRQVRTALHHLFPQGVPVGEAHTLAHGETCKNCELPENVKKRIGQMNEKCIICEPPLYEMSGDILRIAQTCQFKCPSVDFKALSSSDQDEYVKTHSSALGNPPNRAMIASNEGINSDKHTSDTRNTLAIDHKTSFSILATSFGTVAGQRGLVEVDKFFKRVNMVPAQRPSTYVNILGGIALFYLGAYGGYSDNVGLPMIVAGSTMLTKILQYTEEYTAPIPPPPQLPHLVQQPVTGVIAQQGTATVPSTTRFA